MTPLKQTNFRLDEDVLAALQTIKERDGVPIAEQVRRALQAWIESKGVSKSGRAVARTRKRSEK
jgi:hypothetical protein